MTPQHHLPADIERTSMGIITAELAARGLAVPPENAAVVKRVIHTTADFDYAENLRFTPGAAAAGVAAMRAGAVVITDTNMALAGITKPGLAKLGGQALCFMADPAVAAAAKAAGSTRAAAAMHRAAREYPGAVLAVGNAPTALLAIAEEIESGLRPRAGHWCARWLCQCGGKQGAAVCYMHAVRRARPSWPWDARAAATWLPPSAMRCSIRLPKCWTPRPAAGSKKQQGRGHRHVCGLGLLQNLLLRG